MTLARAPARSSRSSGTASSSNAPDWGDDVAHARRHQPAALATGSSLHVMVNAYWEPLEFEVPPPDGDERVAAHRRHRPRFARRHPRVGRRPRRAGTDVPGPAALDRAAARQGNLKDSADDRHASSTELAINTIRTLSIDAVQAANSGHPGTPMALAPLVYTIWNRVMRFDPQDPIWPNRDRFVLSNGHASMLLWSVLHLTGTQAVNADYETARQAVGHARRHPPLPPARQPRARASRVPLVSGVETTTGPLGQGIATSVGMAIAQRWLASRYNQPGFDVFDYDIYAVCGDGCLMEGVGVGGGVARRPPRPRQPLLDLRQQPHHDRRQHADRLHRGRRGALPGLRLERAARGRRERPRSHRARAADVPRRPRAGRRSSSSTATSATARRTGRTPPRRTASRSARRRSGSPSAPTAGRRTRSSWCPTACASTSRPGSARAARRRAAKWTELLRRLSRQVSGARGRDRADAAARAAGRLGPQPAGLSGRREGHRRARRLGPGAERARAEHPLVPRRLGGPRAVEQDHAQVRGRGRLRGRARPAARTCTSASASTRWARS